MYGSEGSTSTEVGIISGLYASAPFYAEQRRRCNAHLTRHQTGGEYIEQGNEGELYPRRAGSRLKRATLLVGRKVRGVIGTDGIDKVFFKSAPQRQGVVICLNRRIDLVAPVRFSARLIYPST